MFEFTERHFSERAVAASELAAYAADPSEYLKTGGHYGSARDRRRGVRMHSAAGADVNAAGRRFLVFVVCVAILVWAALHYLRGLW